MNALRFFYYKLGDKIWGQYGFTDAFNLTDIWFANSYLAIDQGAEIVMIENYRTGLIWKLFMSCPEIKTGMKTLGFSESASELNDRSANYSIKPAFYPDIKPTAQFSPSRDDPAF